MSSFRLDTDSEQAANVKGKKRRFDDDGVAEQVDSTPGMQSMIEKQQSETSDAAASLSNET